MWENHSVMEEISGQNSYFRLEPGLGQISNQGSGRKYIAWGSKNLRNGATNES